MAAVWPWASFSESLMTTMESGVQTPDAVNSDLLRACVTHTPCLDTVRRLAKTADWDVMLDLAERHCVLPLVHRTLCNLGDSIAPRAVFSRLAHTYVASAAHSLRLTGELLRLLDLLETHGIPVVPFKGPVLADLLYGNVSLRQFADLDILIQEKDFIRARQLLMTDGYRPEFELKSKAEQEHLRFEHALQFRKPASGFVLELHWRFGSLNQAFPVDARDVWKRLEPQSFQGRQVRTLSHEDLLLYLSAHGGKHGWDRLEWIVCIAELVRISTSIDWDALSRRAITSGAVRSLHVALLLADDFSRIPLPETLATKIAGDATAQKLARQIRHQLFLPEAEPARREVLRHTLYLRTRERWKDRARIVFHSSMRIPHPNARDWKLFRVPASLSFLYYLLRPIRLMSEFGFRRLRSILRPDTSF